MTCGTTLIWRLSASRCPNQRKVVLTSRSEAVCVSMARQGVTIRMGCLDQQDAFKLFEDKVGSATINADTRIPELARQVMKYSLFYLFLV